MTTDRASADETLADETSADRTPRTATSKMRGVLVIVVGLNAAMCLTEIALAIAFGSASLLADSADFFEDASIGTLACLGLAWSASSRRRLGRVLAGVLLIPGVATLLLVAIRLLHPQLPEAEGVGSTGVASLAVNGLCAYLLIRHRDEGGSLLRAAFLSARNDLLASAAIIAGAVAVALTRSSIPDLVVGGVIALLSVGAAHEVWEAAELEDAPLR